MMGNFLFAQEAHGPLLAMATIHPKFSVTILILNVQPISLIKTFILVKPWVLIFDSNVVSLLEVQKMASYLEPRVLVPKQWCMHPWGCVLGLSGVHEK